MNQRIQELAKLATPLDENGQKVRGLNSEYHDKWMEKFAELIVRECVKQNQIAIQSLKDRPEDIPGWKTMMNLAQVTCKLQIGKHFEVDL